MPQLARELGVLPQMLTNWIAQDRIDAGELPGLSRDERARLHELKRKVRILREEREILRKQPASSRRRRWARRFEMTCRFIDAERRNHAIATMCRALRVSRSGFYAWQQRGISTRAASYLVLAAKIAAIHAESDGTYGTPRVHPRWPARASGSAAAGSRG